MLEDDIFKILKENGLQIIESISDEVFACVDEQGYKYNLSASKIKNFTRPHLTNRNPYAADNIKRYVEVNTVGCSVVDFEYKNCKVKNIPIICEKHKSTGIQLRNSEEIFNGSVCPICGISKRNVSRRISEESVKRKCNDIGVEFISTFLKNKETWVRYICPNHVDKGYIEVPHNRFVHQKSKCKYCAGKGMTTEDFKYKISKKSPRIEIEGEYSGDTGMFKCKCKDCGNEWSTSAHCLNSGSGCPKCKNREAHLKRKTTHTNFVENMRMVNSNIEVLSEYTGSHSYVWCKCKVDGCKWKSIAANLLNGSASCPSCRSNSNEIKIRNFLTSIGFEVWSQYKYPDCKDIFPLPFDMYLPEYNVLIEYDGEQHYMPIPFSGNKFDAEKSYSKTLFHDKIKTDYCNKNKIDLIRIPYWEKNNYKQFLKDKLFELGIPIPNEKLEVVTTAG